MPIFSETSSLRSGNLKDIQAYIFNIGLVVLVLDLVSLAINGLLLWHYCKINVLHMLNKLQRPFWHVFAVAECLIVLSEFSPLNIAGGNDLTLDFDWKDGRYVLNNMYNHKFEVNS